MSLEMAHKVIVPQKKIMSRSFVNSGTLIVMYLVLFPYKIIVINITLTLHFSVASFMNFSSAGRTRYFSGKNLINLKFAKGGQAKNIRVANPQILGIILQLQICKFFRCAIPIIKSENSTKK
jgi:hypothetical protein